MKKLFESVKSELRKYINNCEEKEEGRLNRDNWKGLRDIINSFTHKIYINNDNEGHKKRGVIKTELVEYSIKYLKNDR